jgi:hypothetical protein
MLPKLLLESMSPVKRGKKKRMLTIAIPPNSGHGRLARRGDRP